MDDAVDTEVDPPVLGERRDVDDAVDTEVDPPACVDWWASAKARRSGLEAFNSLFVFRLIPICLLLLFSSLVLPADEVVDYLKRYQGRWSGDFTIHSPSTGYSETFSVEQRYWWEDGQLHGISVSETKNGMQTAKSRTYIQDGGLQSEVVQGETTEFFIGVLHDSGIVWLPADPKRVTDYQIKETFSEVDGVLRLNTDGFDSYVYQDGLAHLVYRGRLVKQADPVELID